SIDQAVVALEQERLGVVEDHVEAGLALGDHARLVPEISLLVDQHPLRERLRAAYLLALYRSGRRADALAAYQAARRTFVDELGIEPGERLRKLHEELLAGAATLSAEARPADLTPRPAQLPPAPGDFTGRSAQVRQLSALLTPRAPRTVSVAVLTGTGGVGKSALAAQAGHLVARHFDDGQLYVDLHGSTPGLAPLAPAEVLGRFLRALGVRAGEVPVSVDEAAAMFRSLTAHRSLLVVLDDAASHSQVRPLIPANPRCAVLVTSRQPLTALEGAAHLRIDVLPPTEAVALLGRIAGRALLDEDPAAGLELARLCGYLPLALRIAAARLVADPAPSVARLVGRLTDQQRRLDELQLADVGVRATLQVSYDALVAGTDPHDALAARAFRLVGLQDGPDFGRPALATLLGVPEEDAHAALVRLAAGHLVVTRVPGRYTMHDLLRLLARELAAAHAEDATAALDRLWRWQLASARAAAAQISPVTRARTAPPPAPSSSTTAGPTGPASPTDSATTPLPGGLAATDGPADADIPADAAVFADRAEALDWMEVEHLNLLASVRQSAAVDAARTVDLAATLYAFCNGSGRWHELAEANRVAIEAAHRAGDQVAESRALTDAGVAHLQMRRFEVAQGYFERALAIREATGDQWGEAVTLSSLGALHAEIGQVETGRRLLERSLALRRAVGDRAGEPIGLANLGELTRRTGDLAGAEAYFEQALAAAEATGDVKTQAAILNNLSEVQRQRGDLATGRVTLERSLVLRVEARDRAGEAHTRANLGGLYRRLGEFELARDHLERAISLATEVDQQRAIDTAFDELGMVLARLGEVDKGVSYLEESLARVRLGRDRTAQANVLRHLADVHRQMGELPQALEYAEQSAALSVELGNRLGEAHAVRLQGDVVNDLDGPAAAAPYWRRAHDLFVAVGTAHAAELRDLLLAAGHPL
ncbi:MAG TPA: tetratricopeptide repeat protein, partial [Pseudonocardiaceae bacterium]